MAKPNKHLDWTDGDLAKIEEPPTGKKLLGWTAAEKPPAKWWNWNMYLVDQWLKYFETVTDSVLANGSVYDAVIGVGGTHDSIPDLMADPDILLKKNILVISPFTLTSTILIDQNDMKFTFTPKATIAKGSIGLGIHIISERITLEGCRFLNFSGASEEALKLSAASKYCIIKECRFLNNDTAINDEGIGNNLTANIEEI
jgi:hypothetical protein